MKNASPPYRREIFSHWLNISVLVAGGVAGALDSPLWWAMTGALEAGALWMIPDVPFWRRRVEKRFRARSRRQERAYYLNEMFGLREAPQQGLLARLFVQNEETDDQLDERLVQRGHPDCQNYLEMRESIRKLEELMNVRNARLSAQDLLRLEDIVNGYLRLLFACVPLRQTITKMDERALKAELRQVEQELGGADPAVKPVLLERQRIAASQLERLPKLQATLQLFRTRADAIVNQVRQIHSQVLADPGTEVTTMLDQMLERQELFSDPIGELSAEQLVRRYLDEPAPKVDKLRADQRGKAAAPARRAGQKN
jgi:hypothetical protein